MTPSPIGTSGVCSGLNDPIRGLTVVLVSRGAELIEDGFGDVLVASDPVVTGYKSVCP